MERPIALRLGTRGSLLARSQSNAVKREIETRHPHVRIETLIIKTSGDQITDRPLYDDGGKGLFVKELEQALLDRQIDFAVHSCKDMPVTQPLVDTSELVIAAMPPRHDPHDLLICAKAPTLAALPPNSRVATGSLRRRCQLLAQRNDLNILPIRGNIDSRLRRLRNGEYDALILALAGIQRAGLHEPTLMHPIPISQMIPAAGQGALALQCRKSDAKTLNLLTSMDDVDTSTCVQAERAVIARLQGDCHSPIGALAEIADGALHLQVAVGRAGGELPVVFAQARAPISQYLLAVAEVEQNLMNKGAANWL